MSFWKWSRTAASNATADGSINWADGQAPSTVNDSARAMMAAASKYRDDVGGAIATAGTGTAYTLSSFQVFDTLAHMDGAMIAFTPHAGNGGACTLNVDATYGAGDGATTFNIPDLRGYLLAGKDDMGGAAASRITAGASGIDGTVLGAAGGAQTVALGTAQMPSHSHGVSDPTHAHGVSDPSHSHGVSDPTHAHSVAISIAAATTGISLGAAATGIAIQAAGGGGAHQNMPPTRICNFIMRISQSALCRRSPPVTRGLDPRVHHLRKSVFEGDGLPGQARQ